MKICPFMSHMLGNEGTNVLEIGERSGAAGDVVVLGYDDEGAGGVKTERKTSRGTAAKKEANSGATHLYCLRDTCRFYRTRDGECTFDAILESTGKLLERSGGGGQKDATASVARELDKFWKFQTQSAAELISSFGDVEKRQEASLAKLKSDVEARLSSFVRSEDEEEEHFQTMNSIRDGIAEIKDTIDARNDGFETLTTTVSDLVLSFDDSIKAIKEQWEKLAKRMSELESIAPRMERVETSVTRTVDNIERLERNWSELMEVVRSERKKGEDAPAAQAKRREAMKFNNLGVTSFHNGDLELARDQFLDAIKRDDTFAECFNNLGLVYTELNEENRAADAFMKAIKLNPELHAAYNNLGYVFYKQGNYQRAVEMYKEALSRSPNNSSAHTNLGNAHFKLGQKQEARRAWEKAIELDPANEKAQRSLRSLDH
jgi:tetratricopeptide (TPR) repeat protein